ncbi:MAG: MFS transporter [Nocardioides sp.]|uniref:MFS transporter n=1 Tax=Nocardioides sp. TaxID=35761 RepID=UPI0039E5094A
MTDVLSTGSQRVRLRDLDPRALRILAGFAFYALGNGLTMPFLYVYLAEVRGFPTATVGWVFAWMGLLGFVVAPLGGTLIDRFGPRWVMLVGLVAEAASLIYLGHVDTVLKGFAVASVLVIGVSGLWPASTAMLTRLVPSEARETVYGYNFMLLNAGLGIGGVISALIIDTESVASFQRLYLINGLTYVGYIAVLLTLPRGTGVTPPADDADSSGAQPSWAVVLRDRTLIRVVAISILAVTFGYAQLEAGMAAYAVDVAEIPARALGWAYAANTGAIVLGQLVALRFIKGRRRSAMLALTAATWSASWVVIGLSDAVPGWLAVAAVIAGLGLFGLGETLWAPVAPAVVNDLAREELRGRYNALQGMTWTIGSIIGPALAGMLIGHGLPLVWVACVVGGTATASLLFLRLRTHLTDAQDGLSTAGPPTLPSA